MYWQVVKMTKDLTFGKMSTDHSSTVFVHGPSTQKSGTFAVSYSDQTCSWGDFGFAMLLEPLCCSKMVIVTYICGFISLPLLTKEFGSNNYFRFHLQFKVKYPVSCHCSWTVVVCLQSFGNCHQEDYICIHEQRSLPPVNKVSNPVYEH